MIQYENGTKDVMNEITHPSDRKIEQPVKAGQVEEKQKLQKQKKPANLSFLNGKVFLDGKVLTHQQVRDILASNDSLTDTNAADLYTTGYSQQRLGKSSMHAMWTFLGVGIGCFIASFLTYDGAYSANNDVSSFLSTMGYSCMGVTIGSTIFCLIFSVTGNNRVNDAISIYNTSIQRKHSSDVSMKFGITQSGGIGFTLDF